MRRRLLATTVLLVLLVATTACGDKNPGFTSKPPFPSWHERVKTGMTMKQVLRVQGPPTDSVPHGDVPDPGRSPCWIYTAYSDDEYGQDVSTYYCFSGGTRVVSIKYLVERHSDLG